MNKTIIYYTSSREKSDLEKRVQENILKHCGNMSIISVSQKPLDFGTNICVGDVGASNFNMCRQIQIASKKATTQYVLSAESDCLYPPDYFTFTPEREDACYRNTNLYVMGSRRRYFYKKAGGATHAQIIGREYYLKRLEFLFKGAPEWSVEEKNFPKERGNKFFNEFEYYQTENPVVQIKTSLAMRHYTYSDRTPVYKLPYWGKGKLFRDKYYYGKEVRCG